jgi:geranylgeranyl pyrophosphate synthase
VSQGSEELGGEVSADILATLSRAHLRLARGQGAELLMREAPLESRRPLDLLSIYALKTAPAFEAALTIGLRAAGPADRWADHLATWCRYLGVAYQVLNDLRDWQIDADKLVAGQDLLSKRPTVIQAFAFETADARDREALAAIIDTGEPEDVKLAAVRDRYRHLGIFDKAEALVERYRRRANAVAAGLEPPALRELLRFIVDVVLG